MKFRAWIGLAALAAFLAALLLSSAPGLHDLLHGNAAGHECAATLIASGHYEHSAPSPSMLPAPRTMVSRAFGAARPRFVSAELVFSILEHAPPAHS